MAPRPVPTPSASPLGPYAPAVRAGDWLVCSGLLGLDPDTAALVPGGLEAEARQALANLTAVLADCGCDWGSVAKVTVFVAIDDPAGAASLNAIYEEAVGSHRPARSTIGVAWLPLGARYEIEAWVHAPLGRD